MEEIRRSCIDCAVKACMTPDNEENYPKFCQTREITDEVRQEVIELYQSDEENAMVMKAAAEVEMMGKMTRVEETMEFAKRIGAKKIGIVTCIGVLSEARMLGKIFRTQGFEVYGVSCKCGAIRKKAIGLDQKTEKMGIMTCDPILQARRMDEENVDLIVTIGLCVGHDAIFYKYAKGLVTTLFTKDKITVHNAVAPLHGTEAYYSYLLKKPKDK